jgi:thioredoxin-like negative regulator of GroEL
MNNIVKTEKPLAIMLPRDDDPYAEVANEGGGQFGKILKYVKGEWKHGDSEVALGTEFLALMTEAMRGDVKFQDGLPVEHRKRNPSLQAFVAACLLRESLFGIDTAVKAAAATGTTRAAVHAALIVLQNGDEGLAASVLKGWEPLSRAADKVRARVKLVEAFNSATPDDRVAFARAIGPTELFEAAIEPAL